MLGDAYDKGQEEKGQVKDDLQTGKDRGQEQAERGKEHAQAQVGDDSPTPSPGSSPTPSPGSSPTGSYRAEG
jgi:hypothetical protein